MSHAHGFTGTARTARHARSEQAHQLRRGTAASRSRSADRSLRRNGAANNIAQGAMSARGEPDRHVSQRQPPTLKTYQVIVPARQAGEPRSFDPDGSIR
jgi:hypothetical protein